MQPYPGDKLLEALPREGLKDSIIHAVDHQGLGLWDLDTLGGWVGGWVGVGAGHNVRQHVYGWTMTQVWLHAHTSMTTSCTHLVDCGFKESCLHSCQCCLIKPDVRVLQGDWYVQGCGHCALGQQQALRVRVVLQPG
jgi:hypothetical protein